MDHHTFADFTKGVLSDSGANLYVTREGHLEYINLWDLDGDGYPELILNNDHNHYETPDVLIYHNRPPWGLRSLYPPMSEDAPAFQNFAWMQASLGSITRLNAQGGGKALLADLKGDGYQDLLFTNFVHGSTLNDFPVYLYWGGPDGFSERRRSLLPVDRGTGIAVGDVDGDGLADIVVSNAGREEQTDQASKLPHAKLDAIAGPEEKRSFIFRQAEGGFALENRETVPTLFALDVKLADLDKSGEKSLIFLEAGKPGALRILRRHLGAWGEPQIIPVLAATSGYPFPPCTRQILVQDLNGDGYPDIFVPSEGPQSEIFWNDHGKFSAENRTVLPVENVLAAAAADLNGDGYADLVTATYYSSDWTGAPYAQTMVPGSGSAGNYETNSYVWWGGPKGFDASRRTALPTLGATSVTLADVHNTGRLDILFSQHRNRNTYDIPSCIYLNSPEGFSSTNREELQGFGAVSILAADLEKSGRKDIVLINRQSGRERYFPGGEASDAVTGLPMYIYKGNPQGLFGPGNVIRVPEAWQETYPAFADMDGSGKAALVYLPRTGHSVVIRYDIAHFPAAHEFTEIPLPFQGEMINVADFDHDGNLDILVLPPNGPKGALIFGRGGRKYEVQTFEFEHTALGSSVGDIDNDGALDLIVGGIKEITILHGNRHDGFHFDRPVVFKTDYATTFVNLADFSGKGWLDLLCQNFNDQRTYSNEVESWVLLNDHGSFSLDRKRTLHTFGAMVGSLAQIWGDGRPAFINSNYLDGRSRRMATMLFRNDKDGYPTEEGKVRLPAYSSTANYALDFTGSGYLDILAINHTGQLEYNGELEPKGGTHGIGSFLYRGGPDGYSKDRVTWIPSFGPHYRMSADPGSLSRRDPFEVYTSPDFVNTTKSEHLLLTLNGRFNRRQFVEPAILVVDLSTGTERPAELARLTQTGDTATFRVVLPPGATFKYRLKLMSSNSGGGPIVSGVRLSTQDDASP